MLLIEQRFDSTAICPKLFLKEDTMAFPIVHVDIAAKDPAAASKFYEDVFGWKTSHDSNFDYHMFTGEGGPGGGWVKVGDEYKVGDVIVYLGTDDIDGALAKVVANGGKVLQPKTPIPGFGAFALFADPTGNRLGLYSNP